MAPSGALSKVKGKEKVPMGTDSVTVSNMRNPTNVTNSQNLPTLKLPSGSSTSKNKAKSGMGSKNRLELTAMFKKLAATRENGKEKKESTLVGFLAGKPKDFQRLFAKLKMEWKPLQGVTAFSVLKFGWFEIAFSDHADFQLIWANMPYHVFSQLLLLKQWYPGFDPSSESISQLDLWVRLHYLPEEFANADALETIIEENCVEKFIKMDPSHNSERWNMFTRFCINTDVEQTFGKGVIVPDEQLNQIKYSLWFDDFSPRCGACRKSAHTFKECPNKIGQIPTLQLTYKKPSSKKQNSTNTSPQPMENGSWNLVGKKNKVVKQSIFAIPNGNIYLFERGGIKVTYESEDSEDGIQHLLESEEELPDKTTFIAVAADLHPYNIFPEEKSSSNKEKGCSSEKPMLEKPHSLSNQSSSVSRGITPILVEVEMGQTTVWNNTNMEENQEPQNKDAPNQSFNLNSNLSM